MCIVWKSNRVSSIWHQSTNYHAPPSASKARESSRCFILRRCSNALWIKYFIFFSLHILPYSIEQSYRGTVLNLIPDVNLVALVHTLSESDIIRRLRSTKRHSHSTLCCIFTLVSAKQSDIKLSWVPPTKLNKRIELSRVRTVYLRAITRSLRLSVDDYVTKRLSTRYAKSILQQ